jgi:putative oxidoreductase
MKKIASLLRLEFVPSSTDAGLLVLRLWSALSLLVLHGWTKLTTFQQLADRFPDPLNVGHRNSLMLALVGEVVCTILVALGLFTRFAALGSAINMAVAFFLANKAALKSANGELSFLYLAAFVVLVIAGPGAFSLDAGGGRGAKRSKPAKD